MIEPFQLRKPQTLIAPLGVKFWDVATGAYVNKGMRVMVYRNDDHLHATQASPNRSGTYVLHHASGLREFEMGVGPPFTDTSPARRPFIIEVTDEERRFLPLKFEAELPCKGLFNWQKTTTAQAPLDPPAGNPGVPLYSSILRAAPAGMAVLRAELYKSPGEGVVDEVRQATPAAWAMLEARSGGRLLGRGIADEKGRVALIFAYPAPHDSGGSASGSPAGEFTASSPFREQEWTIQLQAFYEPHVFLSPPAPFSPPSNSFSDKEAGVPILSDILNQSPASLFLDEAETEPLTEVTLRYGPEVFVPLPSAPVGSPPNPKALSILFVSPAGSPPS